MTMKHVIDGLSQTMRTPNDHTLSQRLGIYSSTITRIRNGKATGVHLHVFDQFQRVSGVSADTLLAWFRLPEGAVLGRIDRSKP